MVAGKRHDSGSPERPAREPGREGIVPGRKPLPTVPPRKLKASFSALATPVEPAEPPADGASPESRGQSDPD